MLHHGQTHDAKLVFKQEQRCRGSRSRYALGLCLSIVPILTLLLIIAKTPYIRQIIHAPDVAQLLNDLILALSQ